RQRHHRPVFTAAGITPGKSPVGRGGGDGGGGGDPYSGQPVKYFSISPRSESGGDRRGAAIQKPAPNSGRAQRAGDQWPQRQLSGRRRVSVPKFARRRRGTGRGDDSVSRVRSPDQLYAHHHPARNHPAAGES